MSNTTSPRPVSSRIEVHRPNGASVSAPADFDPASCPIIARHFFGIEPFRSIGEVAAEVVADIKFRRHVQQVHRLGDRVFGELLAEIGAERSITAIIERKIERYAALNPEALKATDGDEFWPVSIREVRHGHR